MQPTTLIRPLLTDIDSCISDARIGVLYLMFSATFATHSVDDTFQVAFQQIRGLYIELFANVERERTQLQVQVAGLTQQLEQQRVQSDGLAQQLDQQRAQYEGLTQQLEQQRVQYEGLAHQLDQQRVHYEIRLTESRADRAEAIAHDNQNTQVLHNHLLRIPRFATPAVRGSMSRAESWRAAKLAHNFLQQKLPTNPLIVQAMRAVAKPKIDAILTKRYANETMMYPDFLDVLRNALPGLASFHDSSNNPFLNGQKPDITLASQGAIILEPDLVCVVIEVKKLDAGKNLENDKDLGQLLDYLVAMLVAQPGRRVFAGILSSVFFNIVVTLESCEGGTLVQHHISDIYETLAYLFETALVKQSHRPPSPGFIYPHTYMRRRLGNPRHCVVGEFPIHDQPGKVMAIKRYNNPASEIHYLRAFAEIESRPLSIPMLCYVAPDESEFGITPVGDPLVPGEFANHYQAQQLLHDIYSALVWLHDLGIVHRDVRCENVVTLSGRGILIDFDNACDYRRGSARPWRGGYMCAPPSHVRRVIANGSNWSSTLYCPGESDDWRAWVLLANSLMFPKPYAGFQSSLVGTTSDESHRLLALWESLERSKVWGPFVDAAVNLKFEVLRKLPEMFVWL